MMLRFKQSTVAGNAELSRSGSVAPPIMARAAIMSASVSPVGRCQTCVKSPGDKLPLTGTRLRSSSPNTRLLGKACCFYTQIAIYIKKKKARGSV